MKCSPWRTRWRTKSGRPRGRSPRRARSAPGGRDLLEREHLEDAAPEVAHELADRHGLGAAGPPDDLAGAHEPSDSSQRCSSSALGPGRPGQVAQGLGDGRSRPCAQVGGVRGAGSEGRAAAVHQVDQLLKRRRARLGVVVLVVLFLVSVGVPQRALEAVRDHHGRSGEAIVEPADLVDLAVDHVHGGHRGVRVLALGVDGEHEAVGARAEPLGAPPTARR
jgi:hypothetical protein